MASKDIFNMKLSKRKNLYHQDFFAWTQSQADLLKHNKFSEVDIRNLIDEVETLGKSDRRALMSHLTNLLLHMLKMKYQSGKKTASWKRSIVNSKQDIKFILEDSPSLNKYLNSNLEKAYLSAVDLAHAETGLARSIFPKKCPWEIEDIL